MKTIKREDSLREFSTNQQALKKKKKILNKGILIIFAG